ncbi:MAG: aspartyl-phosphate phosphatase Spo0E family protein [Bacillota bacterium]|jgi:acyl carrier protein|uniref:aspartyl-phosphate phosphatase Spo0E family protein n=1 Tax=Bacillus sp. RO2 TaxID=2723913 RepID=UPI00145F9D05|nr:aspartyl-phosphate phosphatase Spo0E family protein [Bacillus sp. RO2]MEA3321847.1 aspartyl-phosphate phosphatase Spo0E family protein [Bacillota bacterium]NMH73380.1 aspartyl-phosphate phosphatase Spo0E family protein [Bacillus sp. RO2]
MKLVELAVEKKRSQMIQTAFKTGLTSVETVRLSQELDEMLNVFIPPHLEEKHINQSQFKKK